MTEHIWDRYLSDRDRRVIEAAGYDTRGAASWSSRGRGDTPVVVVVDMQVLTVGDDVSIFEAIEESAVAMGEVGWAAMDHIVPFVEFARERDVPIVYTRSVPTRYDDHSHPDLDIVEPLAPEADDQIVDKHYASAFHGSDLLSRLVRLEADTLFVVGNTTSGCLRATVVDAQSNGFEVVVPQECTFDRLDLSHAVGLLDMWMKYADVVPVSAAREQLDEMVES